MGETPMLLGLPARHLVLDPAVGDFKAVAQLRVRLPAEDLVDQRVVAVAAVDALGRVEVVAAFELDAADVLGDVDELVDRDAFGAAEVDRVVPGLALGDYVDALEAVGDVHERAGLLAVAPDLDLVLAGHLGLDDLAADRGGGLLAAAFPGAERAVDVVEARDARRDLPVLAEVAAHALGEELLPAVAVLRHRRVGVLFLQ